MAKFQLEGTRQVGIITGGDSDTPDPQKAGRVQVGLPQFMAPDNDVTQLPWSQIALDGKKSGDFTRPPKVGTMVSIYYPPGSKSSMRGIVEYVYSGINTFEDVSGNSALGTEGWALVARQKVPSTKADAKASDIEEDNPSGKPKTTSGKDTAGSGASVFDIIGIISSEATPILTKAYNKVSQVATAVKASNDIAAAGAAIPGMLFSMSSIASKVPELGKIIGLMGEIIPKSGANFMSVGERVSTSGLDNLIKQAQDDIKNGNHMPEEIIRRIKDNVGTIGAKGLEDIETKLEGVFGTITQKMNHKGELTSEVSDIIQELISAFSSLVSSVPSSIGTLLGNSSIPTKLMERLPKDGQQILKEAIQKIPENLPRKPAEAKAFLDG